MSSELDTQFKKAFEKASEIEQNMPPDIMLRLYAYYKQAIKGNTLSINTQQDTRNAFKFNAWLQLKGMGENEAKQEYINLVNRILK